MSSKFADFLTQNKNDPRRILIASAKVEGLRPEDRKQKLAERKARKSEDGPAKDKTVVRTKPRTGRPVTDRALQAALKGAPALTGPQKTRILRAVNRILELRKLPPVEVRALF